MKKILSGKLLLCMAAGMLGVVCMLSKRAIDAQADSEQTILKGIYVEGMDMSGLTEAAAQAKLENYVYQVLEDQTLLTVVYDDVAEVQVSAGLLGGEWSNPELVSELMEIGREGHVVDRYKFRKELERNPVNYEIEISFDEAEIAEYIRGEMTQYDQEVVHLSLVRKDNAFQVKDGATGYAVDAETSAKEIAAFLNTEWDFNKTRLNLQVEVTEPKGTVEELEQVQDIIGTFTSSFAGGTAEKVANISNGAKLIDGITLYPEEEFSFDAYCAPYTVANGYAMGKSYSGGKLVDDVGGGICQVSSTLYNAVLRAELEVTMRYNHSMIVGYVPISSDATLAETAGKDFRFKNNLDIPVYIEAYVNRDNLLIVNVYGKETRPSNRTVEFISETLEVINPGPDVIHVDGTKPVGDIVVSSAYTGYKAKLWKVVKVDGIEKSRELVNSSNYRAVARMATVGMYTTDSGVLAQMNAAVASGNIDHVQNVIAAILAPPVTE